MTKTGNPTLRMVLPIALGMSLGVGLGAVSLANGLFPNAVPVVVAAAAPSTALVAGPGIRFEKLAQNDARCWNAVRSGQMEGTICRD